MAIKNLPKFVDEINEDIVSEADKILIKLSNRTIVKGKHTHKYKNRTHTLSTSLRYDYFQGNKINFYTVYYGEFVKRHYKENWVQSAWDWSVKKTLKDG